MSEREFDAIVIGAGAPGEVCAGKLADGGMRVAIVESHLIGGECSYYACMPSKALLRPGELLEEARRVPGVSAAVTGDLDIGAVLSRRDEVVHDREDASMTPFLEEREIALYRGEGRLDGERRVLVGDDVLTATRAVVVATGSGAARPPVDGLDSVRAWNNRDATSAEEVPESMVVLGGGPVGSELAQVFASLGSAVTLVEGEERLLPREEPFAGDEVAASLRERYGVDVRVGTTAERVASGGPGVEVELSDGDAVGAAEILVAVGRRPRTEGIGLQSAGVGTDEHGFLEADSHMRVGGRQWLYAVGDVNGRALFTHTGKYQAWVAAQNLLGRETEAEAESRALPRATFTDPQIAAVGLTLAGAEAAGIRARAVDHPTDATAGASFYGKDTGGTTRIVVDESRERIVGATFSGFETGEILHAATVAIVGEVPMSRLRHAVVAYPTRSELWLKLLESYDGT